MLRIFGSINVGVVVPMPRLPYPGETVLGGDYQLFPDGKAPVKHWRHAARLG